MGDKKPDGDKPEGDAPFAPKPNKNGDRPREINVAIEETATAISKMNVRLRDARDHQLIRVFCR